MKFEHFLEEEFLKQYDGCKDDAEEYFDAWLSGQDVADIINYANKYADKISSN